MGGTCGGILSKQGETLGRFSLEKRDFKVNEKNHPISEAKKQMCSPRNLGGKG